MQTWAKCVHKPGTQIRNEGRKGDESLSADDGDGLLETPVIEWSVCLFNKAPGLVTHAERSSDLNSSVYCWVILHGNGGSPGFFHHQVCFSSSSCTAWIQVRRRSDWLSYLRPGHGSTSNYHVDAICSILQNQKMPQWRILHLTSPETNQRVNVVRHTVTKQPVWFN